MISMIYEAVIYTDGRKDVNSQLRNHVEWIET